MSTNTDTTEATTTTNTHAEQSRINGAKSKGPISIDGKARSSRNSLKHGFAASTNVVLSIEDKPAFDLHVLNFKASFHPQDYVEHSMVEQLASINWRQSRLVGLETALIDAQMGIQDSNVCALNPICADDDYFHLVAAWQALARQPQKSPNADQPRDPTLPPVGYDIHSIELLRRYQVSLDRQFRNTLLNLRQYRKDFTPEEPPQQDEPGQTSPKPTRPPENRPNPVVIQPLTIVKPASVHPIQPPTPEDKR